MAKPIKITILGDASNFKKATRGVNSALGGIGRAAGAASKIGGVAIAGLGVAALKLGTDFQSARNTIRVATGATGDDLDALFTEAKDVLATVPGSMEDVAAATGAVNTQLGLTGDELEAVTRAGVEFSEVLDTDVASTTDDAARIMNQFGVEAGDADDFFGDLLKTSQDYGVEAPSLLSDMEKMGPALQSIGLEADGAAAFLGMANQAGVDVTRLKSPLLQFASAAIAAGEDPAKAFQDFAAQAEGLTDQTELLALANEEFGTTGGAAIAELVQAGVPLGDLNDIIGDNTGLVGETADETRQWSDKLKILTNKVLVKLEPVLAKAVDFIDKKVVPAIERFAGFLERNMPRAVEVFQTKILPPIQQFVEKATAAFNRIRAWVEENWPQIQEIITNVVDKIRTIVETVLDALAVAWETWGDDIVTFVTNAVDPIIKIIKGLITFLEGVIDFVVGVFTGDWGRAWDGIKAIFTGAWDVMTGAISLAWDAIKLAVGVIISGVKLLWDWSFLSDWVSTAIDKVVGFFTGLPGRIGEFISDIKSAGSDVGSAIIDGIADGITGAVGFVGDFAKGVGNALIGFVNDNIIGRINQAIPDKIALRGLPDINLPDNPIPTIPKLATGGPFRGLALVGERGAEVVDGVGTIRSNAETRLDARPRGNRTFSVVNNFYGPQSPAEIEAAMLWSIRTSGL